MANIILTILNALFLIVAYVSNLLAEKVSGWLSERLLDVKTLCIVAFLVTWCGLLVMVLGHNVHDGNKRQVEPLHDRLGDETDEPRYARTNRDRYDWYVVGGYVAPAYLFATIIIVVWLVTGMCGFVLA